MIDKSSSKTLREVIIREQLKRMFPWLPELSIMLCAYELTRQVDGFRRNEKFEGGKC